SYGDVRLAVAPFQTATGHEREYVRCLSCGNIMPGGVIEGEPLPILTRILWDYLQKHGKGFDLISPGQIEGVYNVDLAKNLSLDPLPLMKTMGSQVKADYILWGEVFQYQERKGTSYGVERPASVSLDLHLLRVKDGVLVWKAQYSKTQKPLSDNLFEMGDFIKSKGKWVTAEELARQGLEEDLKEFPSAQSLQ
ncbi:MAG TPA: hypothetical protein VK564_04195, partial [Thermodesulfobacteriota bacterium]|nr:hypothetical protein [Thermodesulfobacteriota bacterium]